MARSNYYERLVARLKNVPVVAYVLVFASVVVSFTGFIDATRSLVGIFRPASHTDDRGALIARPQGPGDHYHNARIHELGGDTRSAKASYDVYFQSRQDYVDPHFAFQELMKNTEGYSATKSYYDALRAKYPDDVLCEFMSARLLDRDERLRRYGRLLARHPGYLPVVHALSGEYAPQVVGQQTTDDRRKELEYLKTVVTAGDGFFKYFLDKKEAVRLMEEARSRYKLASTFNAPIVDQVIQVDAETYGKDDVSLTVQPLEIATEIWFRLPGMPDFRSTGSSGVERSPGGPRYPNMQFDAGKLPPGHYVVSVKYRNGRGEIVGPLDREFVVLSRAMQDARNFVDHQWPGALAKRLRYRRFSGETRLAFGWATSADEVERFKYITFSFAGRGQSRDWVRGGRRLINAGDDFMDLVLPDSEVGRGRVTMLVEIEFIDGARFSLRYGFDVAGDDEWHEVDPIGVETLQEPARG